MKIGARFLAVAINLQEAAGEMTASEIRSGLSSAVSNAHKGTGKYGSYVDHVGDEDSGDCIYDCSGPSYDSPSKTMKAPYSKGTDSSDDDYSVDTSKAVPVKMRTSWEETGDDADGYAAMAESKVYTPGAAPLCERFVSKKERDAAGSGSFAGKGKSFPILKAADVAAAASSIGRAGSGNYSTDVIKRNIIRIAKEKGWESELPKAWQDDGGDSAKESKRTSGEGSGLKLVESCAFPVDIELREAFSPDAKSLIKLISPGKGSSAYYTEAVLKQAVADKIFHAGVPMRIDHPTKADEALRPEGSVKDWGAVLKEDAQWLDSYVGKSGKDQGPGLYSPIKKFSDHAQTIEEKGPFAGVSICANGDALVEASGRRVMREGVPVLAKFTSAEGVDMVTRAGAGGLFISEAAKPAPQGDGEMTEAEAKRLIETAVSAATAPLRERAVRGDAQAEGARLLESVQLPQAAKTRIIERAIKSVVITADGGLDSTKFREAVIAEAKSEGEYIAQLTGGGSVRYMGIPGVEPELPKPEVLAAREAQSKAEYADLVESFCSMGMNRAAAEIAAKGRAA